MERLALYVVFTEKEKLETALHIHMAKGCKIMEGQANPGLTQNKSDCIKKLKKFNPVGWILFCYYKW